MKQLWEPTVGDRRRFEELWEEAMGYDKNITCSSCPKPLVYAPFRLSRNGSHLTIIQDALTNKQGGGKR